MVSHIIVKSVIKLEEMRGIDELKETIEQKFMRALIKLEPQEFIGVCRIFKVRLLEEDKKTARDFIDIFSDLIENYSKANRERKREALKIVKEATKVDRSKNTKEKAITGDADVSTMQADS